jgi:hypothetical protein
MQPINYITDVQNPFNSVVNGMVQGLQLGGAVQAQQEKQRQIEFQKQMQFDLGQLASKPNPTAQDFTQITIKYPQLTEHFKNTWTMLDAGQQQNQLSSATQVYAALHAGKPEIAQKLLDEQSTAYTNAGDEKNARISSTLSQLIQQSPETARTSAGLFLSSILGPDKFASTFTSLGGEQRAQEKQPGELAKVNAEGRKATYEANNTPQRLALENNQTAANIRNLDSQIGNRAAQLKLDRDKLQSDVELKLYELNLKGNPTYNMDGDAKKLINDSTVASVSADQSAGQILDLAGRLEKEGGGYGAFGTASEWLKKATGNQDSMTQMRNEYTRIRNSQAMKMLPPGSASDKDVAMAMGGFPPETADAKTMASFLRGMAKLNQYTAVAENAKAEWVNSVGHLGKPKTDIVVDGINVPAGSTFTDFARQYMGTKVEQRATQQAQQQIPSRSYMRWAQPGTQ